MSSLFLSHNPLWEELTPFWPRIPKINVCICVCVCVCVCVCRPIPSCTSLAVGARRQMILGGWGVLRRSFWASCSSLRSWVVSSSFSWNSRASEMKKPHREQEVYRDNTPLLTLICTIKRLCHLLYQFHVEAIGNHLVSQLAWNQTDGKAVKVLTVLLPWHSGRRRGSCSTIKVPK